MEIEDLLRYAENKKGAETTFPFDEHTLVMKVGGKMFFLASLEKIPVQYSVKLPPETNENLRAEYPQIQGVYHMNKTHWSSFTADGLPQELIKEMIDTSYQLVFKSLTKKAQKELMEQEKE